MRGKEIYMLCSDNIIGKFKVRFPGRQWAELFVISGIPLVGGYNQP